jgi:2-desacetyl-2-hydroxyethyl bacteriochlorophyllide A dehydrogenase
MWAGVIDRHGGPEELSYRRVERPVPAAGELVVRVRYCALNALDFFVRRGVPGIHVQLPHISGGDVVGWVVQVGAGADSGLLGQLVLVDPLIDGAALGESRRGGLAEFVAVPVNSVIRLDADTEHPEYFAALPIAYGTAYRMLHTRARVQPGETVVVLGAAGGVGVACLQLARLAGARTIACSSSAAKLARLSQMGVDETIDTSQEDFSARVWELTGRKGADLVVDYVGQDTLARSIRCTRAGGRLVTCGASSGPEVTFDLRYVWVRELTLLGTDGWRRQDLEILCRLVLEGRLAPVIHRIFPLSEVSAAVSEVEDRQAFGKVLVEVG